MKCLVCCDLERAFETALSEYIEARSSAWFRVLLKLRHTVMLIWSERGTTLKGTDLCVSPPVGRLHPLPERRRSKNSKH